MFIARCLSNMLTYRSQVQEPYSVGGKSRGLTVKRVALRRRKKNEWSREVHHTWQLDGKEDVKLANKQKVSWINIADEGSSSHLQAKVLPDAKMAKVEQSTAIQIINECFRRWGLPKLIKIDNGYPYSSPKHLDIPTISKLWCIGLGIKVRQNAIRTPQQNGIVEALQGIMSCWTNAGNQPNMEALQKRLNQESDFQRNSYRMPAKQNKTRVELFPDLETNQRIYSPHLFDMALVYEYLSTQVWQRRVHHGGKLYFWGITIRLPKKFNHLNLTITFDPIELKWELRTTEGMLLKTSDQIIPALKELQQIAIIEKNFNTT